MIEGYLQKRAGLRAVAVLVDVRRGVEDEERQLVDFLRRAAARQRSEAGRHRPRGDEGRQAERLGSQAGAGRGEGTRRDTPHWL